ncbi:MAG: hypothetical protein CFE21_11705 [Bacteroidetes bacterium B1(2017)]|nr:MAG: hypothetical protein CFE21_11705 [Bacteroidetes bacterium B1(2017)]
MEINILNTNSNESLLIYQTGYTVEFIKKTITEKKLNGLRIFTDLMVETPLNLDFLEKCTFLESLSITSNIDYDLSFLTSLTGIKKLSLQIEGKKEINLSNQKSLLELSIKWRNKIIGLNSCIGLKKICLIEFKEEDLASINCLINLRELVIKTSSIKSLDGIQNLNMLENIKLGNCKSLESIQFINNKVALKNLEFETCSKIIDFDKLTTLPKLNLLKITDCKDLQSIKFIEHFNNLNKLIILGNTVIKDGDLLPAKNINEVFYKHKKSYNIKIENKSYDKKIRNNLIKINSIK